MLHTTNTRLERFFMRVDFRVEEMVFHLWALLVEIVLKIRKNIIKQTC
jgi:hypothetical protein